MGKNYDKIDIIFIILISVYLITLILGITWFILDRIEKRKISKQKPVIVKANKETKQNIEKKKATTGTKKQTNNNKVASSKSKDNTSKKKVANKKVSNKVKNNSTNRKNGYVSPTKRKKKTKKTTKR